MGFNSAFKGLNDSYVHRINSITEILNLYTFVNPTAAHTQHNDIITRNNILQIS